MELLKLKASEKERKKIIKIIKIKKTLQKQKGLPTLSVDLNKKNFTKTERSTDFVGRP